MNTDKETRKSYKKDIVVGVITALLSSAILWFAEWLLKNVPQIGISLPSTIKNIIYTKAATVTEYTPFLIMLELFEIIVIIAVFFAVFMLVTRRFRIAKETDAQNKEKQYYEEMETCIKNIQTEAETKHYIRKLKKEARSLEKGIKKTRVKLWLSFVVIVLLITLILSFVVAFVIKPIELKHQFDLEIEVIAPYIEEDVLLKLKSDWVLMSSEEDYLEIYKIIDTEFEKLKIGRYRWSITKTIVSGAEKPTE